MLILGLGRTKRVGKDEFAKAWADQFCSDLYDDLILCPVNFSIQPGHFETYVRVTGFASALKAECYDLYKDYGLETEEFYERPENEHLRDTCIELPDGTYPTVREIWINHGMHRRQEDLNYWVIRLLAKARADKILVLIVKDLRFANEIDGVRSAADQCELYEIQNPSVPPPTDVADTQELPPDWATQVFENTGTLTEWHAKARADASTHSSWRNYVLEKLEMK